MIATYTINGQPVEARLEAGIYRIYRVGLPFSWALTTDGYFGLPVFPALWVAGRTAEEALPKAAAKPDRRAGLLLYTLTDDQVIERRAIIKAGYVQLARFCNPLTLNDITLYGKVRRRARKATPPPA